jgi:hypothetical protein
MDLPQSGSYFCRNGAAAVFSGAVTLKKDNGRRWKAQLFSDAIALLAGGKWIDGKIGPNGTFKVPLGFLRGMKNRMTLP